MRLSRVVAAIVTLLSLVGDVPPAFPAPVSAAARGPVLLPERIELVVVPEEVPWLAAAVCPVLTRLGADKQMPLLLAVGNPPDEQTVLFARQVLQPSMALTPESSLTKQESQAARWLVIGITAEQQSLSRALDQPCQWINVSGKPMQATSLLASRFWGTSDELVVAPMDEPAAIILGSAMAARRSIPLVIYDAADHDALAELVARLRSRRVLVSTAHAEAAPGFQGSQSLKVEVLDTWAIERRLAAELTSPRVQNIVVARIPDPERGNGRTAWLAPYLSLARSAPLVLCQSGRADSVENQVTGLIERANLRPRTVTILADYDSIHTREVTVGGKSGREEETYQVATEPCAPSRADQTSGVGVGRIPLVSMKDASLWIARGLVRSRLLARAPQAVMVANVGPQDVELPLCEAISRVTAAELKNHGVKVTEFYRTRPTDTEVVAAVRKAGLLIYEGHIEHEFLLGDPSLGPLRLDGLPVVILQTCESAKPKTVWQLHESGEVAMVGTASEVHSASGSALVKAMTDAILYRRCVLGEALRDAKNYLLCLADLKELRGHSQEEKCVRAALSFRLWGDPELEVFPQPLAAAPLAPVTAQWTGRDVLRFTLPDTRLPYARVDGYVAEVFPASQLAGLLMPTDDDAMRRILPLYYFRLPLPPDSAASAFWKARATGKAAARTALRVDPWHRFVYVLYFPAEERAGRSVTVHLTVEPPADQPGSTSGSSRR